MDKICEMEGVRDHNGEDYKPELARDDRTGSRLVVRAYNECGDNFTQVDLLDLLEWCERNRDLIEREKARG
jgi:hypothetical protein